MTISRKIALGATFLALVCYAAPWAVYSYYLSSIDIPAVPENELSEPDAFETWRHFRGEGTPVLERISPWGVIFSFIEADTDAMRSNGQLHAGVAAMSHLGKNWRGRSIDWHLSSAALTVWITRNMSISEVLALLRENYAFEFKDGA